MKIIKYHKNYSDETVLMWRDSKEKAIGQKEIHSISDQKNYLDNKLSKDSDVYIAIEENKVVGMIAFNNTEILQLYIHIAHQGKGIGKKLLDLAKSKSPGKLTLYTFDVNKRAQLFYEGNGFKIIGRYYENEENLDDIKYEWIKEKNAHNNDQES